MKKWFEKRIKRLKQPKTWIAIAIVAVIAAAGVWFALALKRPMPKYNPDYDDAAQVYFTHFGIAADSNRILFENGALPEGYVDDDSLSSRTVYAYAKVIAVLEDRSVVDETMQNVRLGSQKLLVEITSGEYKGRQIVIENQLNRYFSKYAEPGTSLLLNVLTVPDGANGSVRISSAEVTNYNRTWPLVLISAVFLIVTGLVGGKVGLRSILGLAFTLAAVICVLIPALTRGYAAVPLTLVICVLVTVVCFILLDGLNRKTVSAMLGTIAGFLTAALFAAIAGALTHLDGLSYRVQETEYLIQANYVGWTVDIRGLFVSGVIVSALGAVMDIAMSISSSVNELKTVNDGMRFSDLFKSGMHIGRDAVGTMTNTLILAFAGGALTTLLAGVMQGWDVKVIFSNDVIVHEVITGVAGSVGLILAVPLTALIASALCGGMRASLNKPQPRKNALSHKKQR